MKPGFMKGDIVRTPRSLCARVEEVTKDGYELTYVESSPADGVKSGDSVSMRGSLLTLWQSHRPHTCKAIPGRW